MVDFVTTSRHDDIIVGHDDIIVGHDVIDGLSSVL
jgi:hypothetical protein